MVLLAEQGDPDDLHRATAAAATGSANAPRILDAVIRSTDTRRVKPSGDAHGLVTPLLDSNSPDLVARGARLAGLWGAKDAVPRIEAILKQAALSEPAAVACIEAVGRLGGPEVIETLLALATSGPTDAVRVAAVRAVVTRDVGRAATAVITAAATLDTEPRLAAVIQPVISTKEGTAALDAAVAQGNVSADTATLMLRILAGAGVGDATLTGRLQSIAGIQAARPSYDPAFVKALAAEAVEAGDATRGRQVFLSKTANCTACHKVGSEGGMIGPELTIVGQGRTPELLVESVLWPNRQIREGYVAKRILTDDGRLLTGYVRRETGDAVELFDTVANATVTVPKASIDETHEVGSPMPEGLMAGMTRTEVRDLIRYLIELKPRQLP
jgi:putative heme-binding domain-containing protein